MLAMKPSLLKITYWFIKSYNIPAFTFIITLITSIIIIIRAILILVDYYYYPYCCQRF